MRSERFAEFEVNIAESNFLKQYLDAQICAHQYHLQER